MKQIVGRPGGKSRLVKKLLTHIPEHETYCEPFAGSGALYFAKTPAKKNVLNDNDCKLINFYKQIKKRRDFTCDFPRTSRCVWQRAGQLSSRSPCHYIFHIRHSYGQQGNIYMDNNNDAGKHDFNEQRDKLQKAQVSCGDFRNAIKKHDSKRTFFYIDPPYYKLSCDYGKGNCDVTPQEVKQAVSSIKGKFLLSYNDHPKIRKIFCKQYKCKLVKTKYSVATRFVKKLPVAKELLIKNY